MSTSIDIAFVKQYEREVHNVFQRHGGHLQMAVRRKTNVVGSSTTYQKIGKGTATTKARHGTITPMNLAHTAVSCDLEDFYAGDWVDKLDEAKIDHDERGAIADGGAWALGRKVDEQILEKLDATTQTAVSWNVTSRAHILSSLLAMTEALDDNDAPNDNGRYGVLTPRAWAQAMTVKEFASADYVGANGLPFTEGAPAGPRWKEWMNVKWKQHSGCPGKGTATAKVFVWHRSAVGYASAKAAGNVAGNAPVVADITWHGDRAAHFVNHMMSGGACLIDDAGVVEGNLDDTAAIVTA